MVQIVAGVQNLVLWGALGLGSHEEVPWEEGEGGNLSEEGACGGGELGSGREGEWKEGGHEPDEEGVVGEEEWGEGWGGERDLATWNGGCLEMDLEEQWVGTAPAGICCRAWDEVQVVGGGACPLGAHVGVALASVEGGVAHPGGEEGQNPQDASMEACGPVEDLQR